MTDERTTAYLLNELAEPEAELFEDECFAQPEWPDMELESAEEDLIYAYIKNELSPERRRRFEENYLTTEARRERVLFARSIMDVVCQPKPTWRQRLVDSFKSLAFTSQFPVPKFAAIVLAAGLIATVAWFALRTKPPQTFLPLNLMISTDTRGESSRAQIVQLPLKEDALRITLTLPEPGEYRVQWDDIKGTRKYLEIEKQDAKSISVIIPAGELTPGQYALKLVPKSTNETAEPLLGSYLFEVREADE